jgi:hypothetical protein
MDHFFYNHFFGALPVGFLPAHANNITWEKNGSIFFKSRKKSNQFIGRTKEMLLPRARLLELYLKSL